MSILQRRRGVSMKTFIGERERSTRKHLFDGRSPHHMYCTQVSLALVADS